jgi:acyl-ACP thioesterase
MTGETELVSEPSNGRVFSERLMPGVADATGSGRVRLDALARWLQDVAYHDLLDAGFDEGGAWVVRRQRLLIESFPRFGEPITLRTFCSGLGRFAAERRTSMRGATAGVEAVALWIWLDAETLRPMRFPPAFVDLYSASAEGRGAGVRLRLPDPPAGAESGRFEFRETDIDVAGHVNNSHYFAALEEELVGAEPTSVDIEIEYREPAGAGEATVLRDGDRRWIIDAGGRTCASTVQLR